MATLAPARAVVPGDTRFFLYASFVMAGILVAGFLMQLASGRSSFGAPPLVHAHAVVFFGWVVIYVLQNVFAASGLQTLHRRLGWLAAVWVVPMILLGFAVTVALVQRGSVPFIFTPLQFLIFDPLTLVSFAALTAAAIALRRRTEWHRRLHFCAMAMLLGPGIGRLIPMPLLMPYAWEATLLFILPFPIAGMISDRRRTGVTHPAWRWGLGAIIGSTVLIELLTYGPLGFPIYRAVTAGTPGASVAPLQHPSPPIGPLITRRPASI